MGNTQEPRHALPTPISPPNTRSPTTHARKLISTRLTTDSNKQPLPPATIIRPATLDDLTYIAHLARQHVNSIGFVPTSAYRDHLQRANINVVLVNSQHAGFSLTAGGIRKPYRIIQVAITDEMWRQGIGTHLIALARTTARSRPIPSVTASIRDGLPMQEVALHTGGKLVGISTRPTARAKILTHYVWPPLRELLELRQPHDRPASSTGDVIGTRLVSAQKVELEV